MLRAGIIGATGYTGRELLKILNGHPEVDVTYITSESFKGKPFSQVYPELRGIIDLKCEGYDLEKVKDKVDIIFSALPHGLSMKVIAELLSTDKRVIDLSGDYRLNKANLYNEWYGYEHQYKELLAQSVYGLPEVNRDAIKKATLIANPGCYPTSVLLGICPVLKGDIIDKDHIIVDSKSGVSGGGREAKPAFHFPDCTENFKAYKVGAHQHTPEIEQEASKVAGQEIIINFTPHLVPMVRGILSTIYLKVKKNITEEEIMALYQKAYNQEPFVRLYDNTLLPETKFVSGTNFCDIALRLDPRNNRLIVITAIDNLIKGAAGQAVQNMNIMLGMGEKTALL